MKKNYVKKLVLLINACVTFTMHTANKWCIEIGYARSNVVSKSKIFRIRKSCIRKYEALKPIWSDTLTFNQIFQQQFESLLTKLPEDSKINSCTGISSFVFEWMQQLSEWSEYHSATIKLVNKISNAELLQIMLFYGSSDDGISLCWIFTKSCLRWEIFRSRSLCFQYE